MDQTSCLNIILQEKCPAIWWSSFAKSSCPCSIFLDSYYYLFSKFIFEFKDFVDSL
jgi:hypothetical protein